MATLSARHESELQWLKRAEMALDKEDDSLARAAEARAVGYRSIAESFAQQVEDQKAQVENLKAALLIPAVDLDVVGGQL